MYTPKPIDTSKIVLSKHMRDLTERLAESIHDVWARERIAMGWTYCPSRDDAKKTNPCLVPYDELSDEEQEYDRRTAKEAIKAIVALGCTITTPDRLVAS